MREAAEQSDSGLELSAEDLQYSREQRKLKETISKLDPIFTEIFSIYREGLANPSNLTKLLQQAGLSEERLREVGDTLKEIAKHAAPEKSNSPVRKGWRE